MDAPTKADGSKEDEGWPSSEAPPKSNLWYYSRWFIVLMMLTFWPIGLMLLWRSPQSKLMERLIGSVVGAGLLFVWMGMAVNSLYSESSPSNRMSAATQPGSGSAPGAANSVRRQPLISKAQTPEFVFDSKGKRYVGGTASSVGVAVLQVAVGSQVGKSPFARHADGKFILVLLGIENKQQDAVMMDSSLFRLLWNGKEFSASSEAMTAVQMDGAPTLALKTVNPDIPITATIAFDVPNSLELADTMLQFRGGMTGDKMTIPLRVVEM